MLFLLRIYDYLRSHRWVCMSSMLLCFVLCGIAALQLDYKEDITDFLPLTAQQKQSMDYYQHISRADQIVLIFEGGDTEMKLDAVDRLAEMAQVQDTVIAAHLTTQIDMSRYIETIRWVYAHMPYFLMEADYERMDSVLQTPQAVAQGVDQCRLMMQMPVSGFMRHMISHDPLSLFAPVVRSLQDFQPVSNRFSSMDGYMMTEDERMVFAFCTSPYGAGETGMNTTLVRHLECLCQAVQEDYPEVRVRLLGAPVIAVENATCIKADSVRSVAVALVFIIGLLCYCFRKDLRAIPLIVLTTAFGWLFAMAVVRVTLGGVSIIVLGIGSIIIGIAVNYPLHVLFHQRYTSSTRQTLEEVIVPLVIGNITTVGAFLALIPLEAVALRDLGIFAASMLTGTILFSILFLPQLMKQPVSFGTADGETQEGASPGIRPVLRYTALGMVVVVTALLWYAGRDLSFDADVTHINYMTEQQHADVAYFSSLAGETGQADVYVVESQDVITHPDTLVRIVDVQAVHSPWRWLPCKEEQEHRLALWNDFWEGRRERVMRQVQQEASLQGFSAHAFAPFLDLLATEWTPCSFDAFRPLAEQMLMGYWMTEGEEVALVTRVSVARDRIAEAEQQIGERVAKESNVFDIYSLNASLARQLSDNFDYIGLVCSLLVFVFLWISFRSLRATIVAFLPMAVSWVWIMGIMFLMGLQFNIVNVILATFIFGQGDDYTIFVVEGLQYEHATGKRMLAQFRRSILLSAVIMFAGIGVLVIARHPAMFSLGAVTLIGMAVVVLLANVLPPLLTRLLFYSQKSN